MPKITTNSDPQKKSYTFVRVGENLYRVKETGGYYALVKRNRKQIRRSLKTTDKALAKRRLNVLLQKVDKLRVDPKISNITFLEYSQRWQRIGRSPIKFSPAILWPSRTPREKTSPAGSGFVQVSRVFQDQRLS